MEPKQHKAKQRIYRPSSRLPGFYAKDPAERIRHLAESGWLTTKQAERLNAGELAIKTETADQMIENAIGILGLPVGVAPNFQINGREYIIPMAIEEPSVVAAAAHIGKLTRESGGFTAISTEPVMAAQIQLLDCDDWAKAKADVLNAEPELLEMADCVEPGMRERGGGAVELEVRELGDEGVEMLSVDIFFDVRDAMGANTLNSIAEELAPEIEKLTGGETLLRVLTNLSDRRRVTASCQIPVDQLSTDDSNGLEVSEGIVAASRFAELDPYRAATHNKGIMNGIDAVVTVTGNDWRAVEAGAHAECGKDDGYRPMSEWSLSDDTLRGKIDIPLAVGTVGGPTRLHPVVEFAHQLLGLENARELTEIVGSVGLAQNLGALKALVTDGIQSGHMRLHARTVAATAGAEPSEMQDVVERLNESDKINVEHAKLILEDIRS